MPEQARTELNIDSARGVTEHVRAKAGEQTLEGDDDHLNTPRKMLDENAQPVWQWSYSAFGEEKPTIAKNRFANLEMTPNPGTTSFAEWLLNTRYPGQYFDTESGLHYNYFRSYDPRSGRYSQPDPIGLDGGWSRFSYANSAPLQYVDPNGLFVDDGGFLAVPAAAAAAATAPVWVVPVLVGAAGGLVANEIARTANQREVHRVCDEPPPPALDPCELAKWKLKKALQCRLVRKNMSEKWFGGTYDRGHATRMSQLESEIDRLRKAVDKQCKPCP